MQHYKTGIFDGTDPTDSSKKCSQKQEDLNTALLIIGIGVDDSSGEQFYIAQNTWGTKWGEDGYIRLSRKENFCGMALCSSYPKILAF